MHTYTPLWIWLTIISKSNSGNNADNLVNEDSWFTVKSSSSGLTFLTKDVDSWQINDHFKASGSIVDKRNVVNDQAERAVILNN